MPAAPVYSPMGEIQDVDAELSQFTARFERLVLEKNKALQMARKQHTDKVREHELKAQKLRAEIAASKQQRSELGSQVTEGLRKFHATKTVVQNLTKKLAEAQTTKADLQQALDAKNTQVDAAEDSLRYARTHLDVQSQKDIDESTKFEMYAGLKVEAIEADVLRFRFANIDASDIDKEVSCELHVGGELYRIGAADPSLPKATISEMENALNEHGVIVVFLKQMRKALKDAIE